MTTARENRAAALQTEILGYAFGVSFVLFAHNLLVNFAQARQHSNQRLYLLSLLASTLQCTNVIFLAVQNSVQVDSVSQCLGLVNFSSSCYFVFQIISTGITIYRGTTLLPAGKFIKISRVAMALLLILSICLNSAASIVKTVFVGDDGTCRAHFDRALFNYSKGVLLILYVMILFTFCIPIIHHFRRASESGVCNHVIRDIGLSMGFKIALVVLSHCVTVTLSLAGVFGSYFYIEFLIEDYCCFCGCIALWLRHGARPILHRQVPPNLRPEA
ncbi:hypothetical protein HDU89_004492 [Geranomyces variabilis]|nr:hypothetical protein HDU89_004492 [Geranomyces variabilis]